MVWLLSSFYSWLAGILWSRQAEIAIVGLQASGKTSLINVITNGQFSEEVVPTVSYNLRKIKKGNVSFKLWDIAGQANFRSSWKRYVVGMDALVFVVDSHDRATFEVACAELHSLLRQPALDGVALLVLGNKSDLDDHAEINEIIDALHLDTIRSRPVSCYSCSMKSQHNLGIVVQWLTERGH